MHSSRAQGRRRTLAVAATAAAVLIACAGFLLASPSGPRYEKRGSLHVVREGNSLYSFDPVWRVETLRTVNPATGLDAGKRPAQAAHVNRLRGAMLKSLGVHSLEQVPAEGAAEVEAIRALGYI